MLLKDLCDVKQNQLMYTIESNKRISDILTETEKTLHGERPSSLREEFAKKIDIQFLCRAKEFHVTHIILKEKGAFFPKHLHPVDLEYKVNKEILIVTTGEAVLYTEGSFKVYSNNDGAYSLNGENTTFVNTGDIIVLDAETLHGGKALSNNVNVVSICIPSDPNTADFIKLLDSLKHGHQ